MVERAVGNGSVANPEAGATGRPVIGLDTSPEVLAQVFVRAVAAGELDARLGNMRDLTVEGPVGPIYCPFRAGSCGEPYAHHQIPRSRRVALKGRKRSQICPHRAHSDGGP